MGDDLFDKEDKDLNIDVTTDKKRLEEKEAERASLAKKDKVSFTFSWIAIIVRGIVGTCISIFVFTQANRIEDEDTLARFNLLADHNYSAIEKNITFLTQELKAAGSLFYIFPTVSDTEFKTFTAPLLEGNEAVKHIAWVPLPLNNKALPPEQQREASIAINTKKTTSFITPQQGPPTHDRVKDADITLFVPIINPNSNEVTGIAAATVDLGILVEKSIHPKNRHSVDIYIYDTQSQEESQLLYLYNAEPGTKKSITLTPKDFELDDFKTTRTVHFGDRELIFTYNATAAFTAHTWQATIAAGIAVFITSFIVVTAWILLEIEKRQFSNVLHEEHIQEIGGTIDLLETTKNRMVAQENLASLGGLTAGIAHEIKNPLNFINNFSTISVELISEVDMFLNKYRDIGTAEERDSLYEAMHSLKENINIIHEQGRRADSTIQRMLAHSRGKPGEWGVTDMHKLLDEYINFSFHGMRAKNSSFNVKIEKEFNSTVKEIEVVGNDMSRVFLNLLNNAFQSVDEKKKKYGNAYPDPLVIVKTQTVGNYMRIRIRDNGMGISDENKPNIFTPFFTTKPTGVGTGLGLSLSYNIIVREHNGSLTFDSKENEYCEFIITIPLQPKKEKKVVST